MADTQWVVCFCCKNHVLESKALFDEDIQKSFCSLECHAEYKMEV